MSSSSILHLATHGFANSYKPSESGILFSEILEEDNTGGILFAFEIALMNLPVNLLTLSACETGVGKVVVGEGSLSLTRNFFLAGAQNVLSSLWKVSDEETSMLMLKFYADFLNSQGAGYGPAIRRAKQEMVIAGKGDPYYWSSFILFGR